jgi:hypothetical protein
MSHSSWRWVGVLAASLLFGCGAGGSGGTHGAAVTAPSITTEPVGQDVVVGQPASFRVVASGTQPLSYRWRRDGAALDGATSATYSIAAAQAADAGTYSVVVTNGAGSATSRGAVLTVSASTAATPWLYVKPNDNGIYYRASGGQEVRWMGRGVDVNDVLQCGAMGFDFQYGNPGDAEWIGYLDRLFDTAITVWKANFIRVVMDMSPDYHPAPDWAGAYRSTMEAAIRRVGALHPNVYLELTPYSHSTMVEGDAGNAASFYPTDATFALYRGLVDSFHDAPHVLFGLTNEGGGLHFVGSEASQAELYRRAIAAIRAEEAKYGSARHLVAVQPPGYADFANLAYYETNAGRNVLGDDHVVYEVHYYPQYGYEEPDASLHIPVFIGEYGLIEDMARFYADMEAAKVPNLVWIMDAWGYCTPTVLEATGMSGTNPIQPNALGAKVMSYLQGHAGR